MSCCHCEILDLDSFDNRFSILLTRFQTFTYSIHTLVYTIHTKLPYKLSVLGFKRIQFFGEELRGLRFNHDKLLNGRGAKAHKGGRHLGRHRRQGLTQKT